MRAFFVFGATIWWVKNLARPVGSTGRKRRLLTDLLRQEFPDYDPVIDMARIATDPTTEVSVRLAASKEVAQYIHHKLRAVEVTGLDGEPVQLEVILRPHD